MAGITVADPSIYNNVWRPDPMSGVDLQAKYQGIQQARQQNQLTGQEIQLRQGLSDAAAQSTNPDGTQDTSKFNTIIAHDPRTAWKAQEIFQAGNALNAPTSYTGTDASGNPISRAVPAQFFRTLPGQPGTSQIPNALNGAPPSNSSPFTPAPNQAPQPQISGAAAKEVHDKVDSLQTTAADLANSPNPTRSDAIGAVSDLVSKGHISPQEAVQTLTDPKDPLPQDPAQIKPWAARHAQLLQQKKEVLNKIAPLPVVDPNNPMARITPTSGTLPVGPAFANGMKPVQNIDDVLANQQARGQTSSQPLMNPTTQSQVTPAAQAGTIAQQPAVSQASPGVAMGAPIGVAENIQANQTHARNEYNSTVDANNNTAGQITALDEVLNLSKAGAPTGTLEGKLYEDAARYIPGYDPKETSEPVRKQAISKWINQIVVNSGMQPNVPALQQLQSANITPEQFAATIQELAPTLKGAVRGIQQKAAYYNQVTNNGQNMSQINQAQQNWNNNFDARWNAYSELPTAAAKGAYLQQHPDLITDLQNPKGKKAFMKQLPSGSDQ